MTVVVCAGLLMGGVNIARSEAQSPARQARYFAYPDHESMFRYVTAEWVRVTEYATVMEQGRISEYMAAVVAEREREAARQAEIARQQTARPVVRNTGAHSDAWWHGVAVCEQGGRNHPFFGYFSIMDGSAGGLDWGTQVAMANGIISRYGDGAWAAACVAAGYRESPGG